MGVEHNMNEVVHRIRLAGAAVRRNRKPVLRAVGIQVLSWAYQDYRTKARHGTAPNGIKWDDVTRETLAGRLRKLQSYRNASKAAKRRQIDKAVARHEIGVDTGRLVNSLKAADNKNLQVTDHSVTVGAHMSYAKYFDAARPIFGDGFITRARAAALDDLVSRMNQKVVDQEFD